MTKNCFICDTPLQVFNALNLYMQIQESVGNADLIVVDQFFHAPEITDRLRALGLFENVILAARNPTDVEKKTPVIHDFRRIVDMLNPTLVISRQLSIPRNQVAECFRYKRIYASVMSKLVCSLIQINSNVEFYLFDDGSGSYAGNITQLATWKNRVLSKLLRKGQSAAKPQALYVNNVSQCKSTAAKTILPLPEMNSSFINTITKIFPGSEIKDPSRKIIFLTQPFDGKGDASNDIARIMSVLSKYEEKVLVRFHPRDIGNSMYSGYVADSTQGMWEVRVASTENFDDYILIGAYSTAQQSPKFYFDKEPILIFTYRLMPSLYEAEFAVQDQQTLAIREMYRKPERVMIPKDLEEFRHCLDKAIAMSDHVR